MVLIFLSCLETFQFCDFQPLLYRFLSADSPSLPEQRHLCDGTSVTSVRLPPNEEILSSDMECVTRESRDAVIPVDFLSNSGISSSASEPIYSRDQSQVETNVSSLASSQSSSVPDVVPSKKPVE